MINTFAASDNTLLDIHFSSRHVTFPDENIRSDQLQASVPLLLQPLDARSKSLLFDELRSFRARLKWCALDHSTCIGKFVSYFIFVFLAITLPMLPESVLALIAFFTLFRFFKRYGLRQLLFLDDLQEDSLLIRRGYSRELDKAFRYLAWILFPSFIVEVVHKIIFFSTVKISLPCNVCPGNIPVNPIMFVLVLASWVYRTGVFLLVCVLFRLTCELQILRFEGLHKLFDGCESVSQFGSLWLVLGFNNEKNFFNSGDLVICSAVQLSGAFLCLLGAARITHRAQGIVSIATRWQMSVASASTRIDQGKSHVPEADKTLASNAGENESDSSDIFLAISSQDSYSFQTRQALGG
ncbi:hypothetical protein OIU77_031587 [Salix suchowensis]|uniref:Uncharacterized protein n=1 Tax=Salix suchowensis TaxID=1278906 RepID=A0ABQ9BFZ7_9ROSI|nr:hypothetical protein OIU77_031587 [Salix suchowensis]